MDAVIRNNASVIGCQHQAPFVDALYIEILHEKGMGALKPNTLDSLVCFSSLSVVKRTWKFER